MRWHVWLASHPVRTTMATTPRLMTVCGNRVSSCSWPSAPLPVRISPTTAQMKPVTATHMEETTQPERNPDCNTERVLLPQQHHTNGGK